MIISLRNVVLKSDHSLLAGVYFCYDCSGKDMIQDEALDNLNAVAILQ